MKRRLFVLSANTATIFRQGEVWLMNEECFDGKQKTFLKYVWTVMKISCYAWMHLINPECHKLPHSSNILRPQRILWDSFKRSQKFGFVSYYLTGSDACHLIKSSNFRWQTTNSLTLESEITPSENMVHPCLFTTNLDVSQSRLSLVEILRYTHCTTALRQISMLLGYRSVKSS